MKKHIQYTDEPIGDIKIIKDFLPSPEKLVFKRKSVKITMALDVESVDFFKKIAHRNHVPYQTMLRNLINAYVAQHQIN
ncbi:MAG: CopG family transcriptional regulator [Candidatus Omnitrophica bacterium]|nr:CopG family transcriptional regulator [Candidatus Omnitrophota bacterium]